MSYDPLSDALALMDARCVISGGFLAGGAWARRFAPQARLKLTAVVMGSCWLAADGLDAALLLERGDVAVLNDRSSVVLSSDPGIEPTDSTGRLGPGRERLYRIGTGDEVQVIGGHVELDHSGEDLLLAALPALKVVRAASAAASPLQWLLDRLTREMATARPGHDFAADQYAQLLLVEVLRAHLADAEPFAAGWLRAVADERLAPALALMHGEPERPWRLAELARASFMSRTTFAARFKAVAGVPPLTYLHEWRMRLAQRALREGDATIATIADTLGYGSESAFSAAFKRTLGVAPRRYRDASRVRAA